MSVIAWARTGDEWAIAADTAETSSVRVSCGLSKLRRVDDNVVIGLAGTSAHLTWLHRQKWLIDHYDPAGLEDLACSLDERLRAWAVEVGHVQTPEGIRCHGFEAIVAGFGLAFVLDGSGAVVPVAEDYAAVGSGARVAYGALWAGRGSASDRAERAVLAAIRHANGCGGDPVLFRGLVA